MFKIQPIQNKTEQENAAVRCGVPYLPDAMAYAAEIDGAFSGICQFSIRGEHGMIHHLVPLPGVDDYEVMFIMGRATMNFIDLCGIHTCLCDKNAGDPKLLRAIGFTDNGGELLFADMTDMFNGKHCASKQKPESKTKSSAETDA